MKPKPPGETLGDHLRRVNEEFRLPRGGGLIPPPEWALRERIAALEGRVAELERIVRAAGNSSASRSDG